MWEAHQEEARQAVHEAELRCLAAGEPIYYFEDDTPEGLVIRESPDGTRVLVAYRDGEDHDAIVATLPNRTRDEPPCPTTA
ncbi:hypothetical protein XEUV683_05840 [Xanthomonas euvesicatoria]|nr:hypothetical protein XEUV685_21975 [Xanthomonas euvesicatoria]KLA54505.1 hypothetical protein XEUV684_19055 [Xanthomonas euvesicatoria]KLA55011.1 hypothetical protein XEUV683_05840 [Xanthomonas euvesicatoria]KLA62854.1 hypothetical protein XEUV695_21675 [Xanthomonas euvesicatoria]KLA63774.1 hypothetical protein XEUV689_19475 [Xanthomonas euvesicatoria]